MSPAIVDKDKKRQDLIEAALAVFSKLGYAAASMDKIGEAAGVGKSTIYEYFESKTDVFIAAFEAWIDQICHRMTNLMSKTSDPIEKLSVITTLATETGSSETSGNRMYLEMVDQMHDETGVLYHQWNLVDGKTADIRRILTDVLLEGISTGVFKATIARDVEQIGLNIMGCLDGLLFNTLLGNKHFNLKWQVDFYLRNLIAALRTSHAPEKEPGGLKDAS